MPFHLQFLDKIVPILYIIIENRTPLGYLYSLIEYRTR